MARLLAVAAAILFSTGGAGIKVEAFSAAQVSMMRSGIAAVVLWLWVRRVDSRAGASWTGAPLIAAVVYAAMLTLFVAATKLTTAANAIFLQSTAPLYLLILAPLILGERFRARDLVYLGALGVGLACCFMGRPAATAAASDPPLGNLLGAASGFVWALTLISLRYVGRSEGGGSLKAVVTGNALACLLALPLALPVPVASAAEWATVIYLGVFQIGLAYLCLSVAISRLPALEVSLLLLLEPVLNPVWTWLIRGEDPGGWTIAGGAVIVAATGAKILYDARRPPTVPVQGPTPAR
jgi:drug/metabolite transporter (DMT)-like permease